MDMYLCVQKYTAQAVYFLLFYPQIVSFVKTVFLRRNWVVSDFRLLGKALNSCPSLEALMSFTFYASYRLHAYAPSQ